MSYTLPDIAAMLEVFFKGLTDCGVLMDYTVQLQMVDLDFSLMNKLKKLILNLIKNLKAIYYKFPTSYEEHIKNTNATNNESDDGLLPSTIKKQQAGSVQATTKRGFVTSTSLPDKNFTRKKRRIAKRLEYNKSDCNEDATSSEQAMCVTPSSSCDEHIDNTSNTSNEASWVARDAGQPTVSIKNDLHLTADPTTNDAVTGRVGTDENMSRKRKKSKWDIPSKWRETSNKSYNELAISSEQATPTGRPTVTKQKTALLLTGDPIALEAIARQGFITAPSLPNQIFSTKNHRIAKMLLNDRSCDEDATLSKLAMRGTPSGNSAENLNNTSTTSNKASCVANGAGMPPTTNIKDKTALLLSCDPTTFEAITKQHFVEVDTSQTDTIKKQQKSLVLACNEGPVTGTSPAKPNNTPKRPRIGKSTADDESSSDNEELFLKFHSSSNINRTIATKNGTSKAAHKADLPTGTIQKQSSGLVLTCDPTTYEAIAKQGTVTAASVTPDVSTPKQTIIKYSVTKKSSNKHLTSSEQDRIAVEMSAKSLSQQQDKDKVMLEKQDRPYQSKRIPVFNLKSVLIPLSKSKGNENSQQSKAPSNEKSGNCESIDISRQSPEDMSKSEGNENSHQSKAPSNEKSGKCESIDINKQNTEDMSKSKGNENSQQSKAPSNEKSGNCESIDISRQSHEDMSKSEGNENSHQSKAPSNEKSGKCESIDINKQNPEDMSKSKGNENPQQSKAPSDEKSGNCKRIDISRQNPEDISKSKGNENSQSPSNEKSETCKSIDKSRRNPEDILKSKGNENSQQSKPPSNEKSGNCEINADMDISRQNPEDICATEKNICKEGTDSCSAKKVTQDMEELSNSRTDQVTDCDTDDVEILVEIVEEEDCSPTMDTEDDSNSRTNLVTDSTTERVVVVVESIDEQHPTVIDIADDSIDSDKEANDTVKFVCIECDCKEFDTKQELEKHFLKHGCFCGMCQKTFPSLTELQEHRKSAHEGYGCFVCSICFKSMITKPGLERHLKSHNNQFKCTLCSKSFVTKLGLTRHLESHGEQKLTTCNTCGKSFKRADYLQVHKAMHAGKQTFACKVCPKRFVREVQLKVHEKIHSGVKDHICDICNKAFARNDKLKEHMMRHYNIKRFQCPVCFKYYSENRDLKIHMRSHSSSVFTQE